MPLPLAIALAPDSYTEQFTPARDLAALKKLTAWFLRFSPLCGIDPLFYRAESEKTLQLIGGVHYGVVVDLTGTDTYHGDLPKLVTHIASLFEARSKLALAPTLGAAWALSRFASQASPTILLNRSDIPLALSNLPTSSLRISESCASSLREVGLATIGQLLSIPRQSLSKRFGKYLLCRLEQALGYIEERVITIEEPTEFSSYKVFEPPLTNRKNIVIAIGYVVKQVLNSLRAFHKSAGSFSLLFTESDGRMTCKEFSLVSANSSNESHFFSILEPIVDSISFFGELHRIEIIACQIAPLSHEQTSFSSNTTHPTSRAQKGALIDTFAVRLGKERISTVAFYHSHIPERSFSYVPYSMPSTRSGALSRNVSHVAESAPPYTIHERPTYILSVPEPITALSALPDKPPSLIIWKTKRYRIITGIGPERIAPEWWKGDLQRDVFSERDYFKIQDEHGRWLWVFREQNSMDWCIHGMWV